MMEAQGSEIGIKRKTEGPDGPKEEGSDKEKKLIVDEETKKA